LKPLSWMLALLALGGLAWAVAVALKGRDLRRRNAELERLVAERTADLERVNRHRSEFLANMSHELRTPLNAIIGFSDVMLGGMIGAMPDKQKEFVGDIRDSGRHLLALINDILDLSRVEAGRMELQRATFDLERVNTEAITLVRGRAERHRIELRMEVEAGIGAIDADERKFKQILLNLLSNAVKFTPQGGVVTLSARRVAEGVRVSVADTGVGMSAEDQGAIFQEFREVGNDPDRRAEGTGLGLALTKRLVELHGGSIRVESAPGRGSTFTFELPVAAT
jgi:signal transduction histidine kinase